MKLNTAQLRRLESEVAALEVSGWDRKSARVKAEGEMHRRVRDNKSRTNWRRQRGQAMADEGYSQIRGWV